VVTRTEFAQQIAEIELSHTERALAFLWYYRQTQEYEERAASELANDLHDEGFPKPNVSRLHESLIRSRFTIKGRRKKTFQIDVRKLQELNEKYGDYLKVTKVKVTDAVIPNEWVRNTRPYLEMLVYQINGSYDAGFYDCCAVLCRRLMESLLIETYISQKRHHEIQNNGMFFPLEKIINYVRLDNRLVLSRNTPKTMNEVKLLGDTAAHDRTYITHQTDIDDIKLKLRRVVQEFLSLANVK